MIEASENETDQLIRKLLPINIWIETVAGAKIS
jgi:hypothetical protein